MGRYRIDIAIQPTSRHTPPIALEIDGYRHLQPDAAARDARKDDLLRSLGYRIIRVKELTTGCQQVQTQGDTILYPHAEQYRYLNEVIRQVLALITGSPGAPDHVRDHWKIEDFYYHIRRERSLAVLHPELARQWSCKNPDTPEAVSPGSGVTRWWDCPKCGRDYQATVLNRTQHHSGCPYCAHLRVTPKTCLSARYPQIAAQWDLEKNAPLTPEDVLPGSDKTVWWKCSLGHSWQTLIYVRTGRKPSGCPYCHGNAVTPETSLAGKSPELALFWDSGKNPLPPTQVAPHSNKPFWWRCPEGHQWQAPVNRMQRAPRDRICPYCHRRKLSLEYSLAAENPELAAFWDAARNGCPAEEVPPHSNKRFWWRCEKGHQWQESPSQMQYFGAGKACPYCHNRRVWEGNSLAVLAPELAAQWHPAKNLPLTPETVFPWHAKKVWWQCPAGHQWQNTPQKRYHRGDGCPYCSGRRASPENCLSAKYPEIARDWDPDSNGTLTPGQVTPGSTRQIWWKCVHGHAMQMTVANRVKRRGCPVCAKKR